jgi:hypothetical protein
MYVLAPNQTVEKFPYSVGDLRSDNPQTSFPANPTNETLASFNVFTVVSTSVNHDPAVEVATLAGCAYIAERQRWETTWTVRSKTAEELADEAAAKVSQAEAQRAQAYRNESDPIFFMWQRNEATEQQWLDKVAEIKARYPA